MNPYVYSLSDQNGVVFYIGKGRGARMYQHATDAKRGVAGPKADRIRLILAGGGEVTCTVLGEYGSDVAAGEAERESIAQHQNLTNLTKGGEGCSLDARQRMQRKARSLLDALMPYPLWLANIRAELVKPIIVVFGSIEACYVKLRDELVMESIAPQPNVILVGSDGAITWAWE